MPDKLRERFYLDLLRRALPEIPTDKPDEPEPPDFLFRTSNGSLGIELTVFHLPPPPGHRPHQEQQSLKDRIVTMAERLHHEAGGPPLYVGVHFNENYVFDKKDTNRLAKTIAASVLSSPAPQSIRESVSIPWGRRPEETIDIHIMKSLDGEDKLWHADAGGWVADITPSHVRSVLGTKAEVATKARTLCDRLWLVIVNDPFSRGAPAEAPEQTLDEAYEAPFDRVIWFIPFSSMARDLKLRTPAA